MWEPNVIQEVLFLKFGSPKEWERWITMKGLKQSPQSIIVKENVAIILLSMEITMGSIQIIVFSRRADIFPFFYERG